MINLKSAVMRYIRVLQISRKPGKDEFVNSSKISALGLLLIGAIGFVIFMGFVLFLPF
jgi:protein transport protein SEC61 subunit gamma-like protein